LVGARFARFTAIAAVAMLCCVLCTVRLAFAANLRAKLTKARVPLRTPHHNCGGYPANVGTIETGQCALDHFRGRVADVFRRALVTRCGTEDASLDRSLHILFGFFAHDRVSELAEQLV
jgi:hypothetical protein